jgi:SAM-dependent methyltransferase
MTARPATDAEKEQRTGCPACGASGAEPFADAPGFQLVRCRECTLVYSDPQPRAEVRARYLEEYNLAAHFEPLKPRKRVHFERRLDDIPPPARGRDRLCDVGCADGQFIALARERGWKCLGVELNPPAAAQARSLGFEVVEGAFETLEGLRWGEFDLVTCFDCLEHTPEPQEFAERLVRLVKPTGTILVSTLHLNSLAYRVFGSKWSMIHEDHFTYWSAESLERLFERLGWKTIESETFGLGRDFVGWVDAIQRLRRHSRTRRPSLGDAAMVPPLPVVGWDVNRGVLTAERLLNRMLAATRSGVEITCTLRRERPFASLC